MTVAPLLLSTTMDVPEAAVHNTRLRFIVTRPRYFKTTATRYQGASFARLLLAAPLGSLAFIAARDMTDQTVSRDSRDAVNALQSFELIIVTESSFNI